MDDLGGADVNACSFCDIAAKQAEAVVLFEDDEVLAFLDTSPIRRGHSHIIPKQHFATFDVMPPALAGRIIALGQELARRLKATYKVERVAFLFTGGDVAHAHAHLIPMHEKTDVTSARYILNTEALHWSAAHLLADRESLLAAKAELGFET